MDIWCKMVQFCLWQHKKNLLPYYFKWNTANSMTAKNIWYLDREKEPVANFHTDQVIISLRQLIVVVWRVYSCYSSYTTCNLIIIAVNRSDFIKYEILLRTEICAIFCMITPKPLVNLVNACQINVHSHKARKKTN